MTDSHRSRKGLRLERAERVVKLLTAIACGLAKLIDAVRHW